MSWRIRETYVALHTQTHNGAAADDADQDDETVVVEVLAQHEYVGVGGLVALVVALVTTAVTAVAAVAAGDIPTGPIKRQIFVNGHAMCVSTELSCPDATFFQPHNGFIL